MESPLARSVDDGNRLPESAWINAIPPIASVITRPSSSQVLDSTVLSSAAHEALADKLRSTGLHAAAAEALRAALRLAPENARIHRKLGDLCLHQGTFAEGLHHAREAAALAPKDAGARRLIAQLLLQNGDAAAAEEAALDASGLDENDPHARGLLAAARRRIGDLANAEVAIREAIALAPSIGQFLHTLSGILADQGRLEEAIAVSRQAVDRSPRNYHLHWGLAVHLARAGRHQEAAWAIRAVITLKPEFAPAYTRLGHILITLGDPGEAIEIFRAALRLAPDDTSARAALRCCLASRDGVSQAIATVETVVTPEPTDACGRDHSGARSRSRESPPIVPLAAKDPLPTDTDRIRFGKDGYLFHRVDAAFEQMCGGIAGSRPLECLLSIFEARHAWCHVRNVPYRLLIVPERHVLYGNKLPPGYAPHPDRPARRLVRMAEPTLRNAIVYPEAELLEGRKRHEVCYQTDVHWTWWGAYLCYRALMETLNPCIDRLIPESALLREERQRVGDMMMWLEKRDRELSLNLKPPPVTVKEVLSNRTFKVGQVDVFETEHHDLPRLVLFRTSNSTTLLHFLFHHFSRIVAVASTAVHYDLLRSERPDVVISEIPERYLATPAGSVIKSFFLKISTCARLPT
jgi:alginate O-acetyltransferase complex protein AlgJ